MAARRPETSGAAIITASSNTNRVLVSPQSVRRQLQNFLLIWLNADFDEVNAEVNESLQYLQQNMPSVITFTDGQDCFEFLDGVKEKVFMIVSGSLGQLIVPVIQDMPQLQSIYILCTDKSIHEE